jgi:hypothetical protein
MASNYLAKGLKRSTLTVALGLCVAGGVQAQSTSGNIYGTAAPGATVTVTNNSGFSRTVTADENGRYNASNLPVGNYTVVSGDNKREVTVTVGAGANVSFTGDATTLGAVTVVGSGVSPIDVSTVSTSTVMTSEQLVRLPLARNAESVALLSPGAVAGNGVFFGNVVSFGGASVAENAYYINGFFTGNPMTNVGGYTLPYGSIDQQETYTGGYSAKYGRSDGGVINQIGKSGTNEFHFGGQITWAPKNLRADGRDLYLPNDSFPEGWDYNRTAGADYTGIFYDRYNDERWEKTYSAYVSGPLMKDRLFGFLSLEQDQVDTHSFPTALGAPQSLRQTSKNPKLYSKLNWNINDNNLLELTYMAQHTKQTGEYYDYDFDTDAEGSANGSEPNAIRENDEFSIAKYTSYLTDNLTLSALYGHSRLKYLSVPFLTGDDRLSGTANQNPAYWPDGEPITNNQVGFSGYDAADYGDGARVELEWVLGSHTLTGGYDWQKFEAKNEGNTQFVPLWEYRFTNNPNNNINTRLGVGAPGENYYVDAYLQEDKTSMSLEQKAWYLEDKWQVTDNLLLSLGIRNDQFVNKNDAGKPYVDSGDQWAPRLGFSWDVFGDSKLKVFGNAGRYYLALPQAVAVRGASASLYTREYFTYTGIDASGRPTGLTPVGGVNGAPPPGPVSANGETGAEKDPNSFTPTDLKSEFQDEYILGFETQLTDKWTGGAKFTYRDLKAAMDDTCDYYAMVQKVQSMGIDPDSLVFPGWNTDGGCFIVNVGDSNTFSFANADGSGRTEFQMTPDDWHWTVPMKRTYKALDLFVEHPFDGKWEARVDYTYAKSYGNMEGPANSDSGQGANSHNNGVATSVNWDFAAFMVHSMGYLPNDRRHTLKAHGSYSFSPEWLVSANLRIQSGMPVTCWGYFSDDGTPNETDPGGYASALYHTCFGEASPPGKTYSPWTHRLDLGVTYKPAFADHKLALSMNVFNALNESVATTIDGTSETEFNTVSNTYGTPITLTTPRYVMFSATYDW